MPWFLAVAALAATADAKFADTQGFSGKHGVDCSVCHTPMPVDPHDPARVTFSGLPEAWDPEATYALTVRVDGGPPANPVPGQPQAGFDIETDGGLLGSGPSMDGLLRFPSDHEATYTAQGTLVREWSLTWTAPGHVAKPVPVTFWLAVVAADGNHIMGGPDAVGERGDRVASTVVTVPPSEDAAAAWAERPVPPPMLDPLPARIDGLGPPLLVTGRVADHVDHAQWRVDAGTWTVAAGGPTFLFYLPPLPGGDHVLQVRAVYESRTSGPTSHAFNVEFPAGHASEAKPAGHGSPWLIGLLAAPLAVPIALTLFRPRTR